MLTPEYLQEVTDGAVDISADLHARIIAKIIKRLVIRMEETGDVVMTGTDKFQIETLRDAGYLLEDIQADIATATGLQREEIQAAFQMAGVEAFDYDTRIYQQAGLIAPDVSVALSSGASVVRPPTTLNQSPFYLRVMQRSYEATNGTWENYTRTFADAAYSTFITECDTAYNLAASGAVSMSEAIRECVGRIAKDGVTIEYRDAAGEVTRRDSIETATARAVRTGIGQACADVTDARMGEMGWDIVLTSAHMGARPGDGGENYTNHAWWQGKFFSVSGKDTRYPPFAVCGRGQAAGICGINCRHSYGPGDGKHNPFDKISLEKNEVAYRLSQRQRALETRVRTTKNRLAGIQEGLYTAKDDATRAALNTDFERVSALLGRQNSAYSEFCRDNNLKTRYERMEAARWDRELARQVRAAEKRYYEE